MPWSSWDATPAGSHPGTVDHTALFEFDLNGFLVVLTSPIFPRPYPYQSEAGWTRTVRFCTACPPCRCKSTVLHCAVLRCAAPHCTQVKGALSDGEVAAMNAALEGSDLFQEEVVQQKRADGTRFSFCQTHPMFMELLEHPLMLQLLVRHFLSSSPIPSPSSLARAQFRAIQPSVIRVATADIGWLQRNIMGEWFRLDHATGIAMTADAHAKGMQFEVLENLHGGEKGDQGEHHYQYHQGRIYNNLTVAMFMLADVNPGDGGLTIIPGSHKSKHPWPDEVYPHTQLAESHLVHQPSVKAGDMLIFTEGAPFYLSTRSLFQLVDSPRGRLHCPSALIHGTTYWTGAQDRRLVSFKFCPGHVQYIAPSNPSSSHHLLPYATSDLQRQLLDHAWVGRPKVAFPPGVGAYSLTTSFFSIELMRGLVASQQVTS
eukprot:COSAG02_NODE_4338_length_5486_cov_2.268053_1_plen_429_part_00